MGLFFSSSFSCMFTKTVGIHCEKYMEMESSSIVQRKLRPMSCFFFSPSTTAELKQKMTHESARNTSSCRVLALSTPQRVPVITISLSQLCNRLFCFVFLALLTCQLTHQVHKKRQLRFKRGQHDPCDYVTNNLNTIVRLLQTFFFNSGGRSLSAAELGATAKHIFMLTD